jgi:hypothetical protein
MQRCGIQARLFHDERSRTLARNANAPDAGALGEGALLRHLYWVN